MHIDEANRLAKEYKELRAACATLATCYEVNVIVGPSFAHGEVPIEWICQLDIEATIVVNHIQKQMDEIKTTLAEVGLEID